MHASYFFLIDGLEMRQTDKRLSQEAMSRFLSRYEDLCNENNWYQEEVLLLSSGRLIQLCDTSDFRGRDVLYREWSTIAKTQRWPYAMRLAAEVVALDMGVRGAESFALCHTQGNEELSKMSREQLVESIRVEIPQRLAKSYQLVVAGKPSKDDLDDYRRSKLAKQYEYFRDAERSGFVPFTTGLPYPHDDYRCIDLRDNQAKTISKSEALIVVDIHT